jgi:hypothetical protein
VLGAFFGPIGKMAMTWNVKVKKLSHILNLKYKGKIFWLYLELGFNFLAILLQLIAFRLSIKKIVEIWQLLLTNCIIAHIMQSSNCKHNLTRNTFTYELTLANISTFLGELNLSK